MDAQEAVWTAMDYAKNWRKDISWERAKAEGCEYSESAHTYRVTISTGGGFRKVTELAHIQVRIDSNSGSVVGHEIIDRGVRLTVTNTIWITSLVFSLILLLGAIAANIAVIANWNSNVYAYPAPQYPPRFPIDAFSSLTVMALAFLVTSIVSRKMKYNPRAIGMTILGMIVVSAVAAGYLSDSSSYVPPIGDFVLPLSILFICSIAGLFPREVSIIRE